jgi:thiamine kinase-like enzyme
MPSPVEQPDLTWIHTLIRRLSRIAHTSPEYSNIEFILQTLRRYVIQPNCFIALTGGYSNQTYRVGSSVFRLPKKECPLRSDLAIEVYHLQIVHAFGFSPLELQAYSVPDRLLITRYLPNLQTPVDLKQTAHLESLAYLVKRLHSSQAPFKKNESTPLAFFKENSPPFLSIQTLLTQKEQPLLARIQHQCLEQFASFSVNDCPTHGDLHHGNVVITQNGALQLIDWEFAGRADPAHDIARLFAISEFNAVQRAFFLTKYAEYDAQKLEINLASLKQRIALAIPIHYFSVVLWTKFASQFIDADSQSSTLLNQTIVTYRQKTLDALDDLAKQNLQKKQLTFFKSHYAASLPTFVPISTSSPTRP